MNDCKKKEEKIIVIKKPKPKEEEDLDDFIFKDEPVKHHSER